MCVSVLAFNSYPDYELITVLNRDEFYKRNTIPAHYWKESPNILAGKDVEGEGTWVGVSRTGKCGLLTNYRDPKRRKDNVKSRGSLVTDFLLGNRGPFDYCRYVKSSLNQFNDFNLILFENGKLVYLSSVTGEIQLLNSGLYGLSNGLLDSAWPKVRKAKNTIQELLHDDTIRPQALASAMKDTEEYPDNQLPDTGIEKSAEKILSAIFVKTGEYGTRSTTVVTISKSSHITFFERTYTTVGDKQDDKIFDFRAKKQ